MEIGDGMYYNKWVGGNQISMPQPIYDGSVDYDDGTDNNAKQLTEDVVTFLKWAAEPELEVRKNLGIKVILFLQTIYQDTPVLPSSRGVDSLILALKLELLQDMEP